MFGGRIESDFGVGQNVRIIFQRLHKMVDDFGCKSDWHEQTEHKPDLDNFTSGIARIPNAFEIKISERK